MTNNKTAFKSENERADGAFVSSAADNLHIVTQPLYGPVSAIRDPRYRHHAEALIEQALAKAAA